VSGRGFNCTDRTGVKTLPEVSRQCRVGPAGPSAKIASLARRQSNSVPDPDFDGPGNQEGHQGHRIVRSDPSNQTGVVPAGLKAFGYDGHHGDGFLTQQIECQPMQDRLILVGMALADAALVLMEGDIEDPLHTVLDASVGSHGIAEGRGVAPQAHSKCDCPGRTGKMGEHRLGCIGAP
jgi:hypothetical protein